MQLLIHYATGDPSRGVKWPECEADHSVASTAKVSARSCTSISIILTAWPALTSGCATYGHVLLRFSVIQFDGYLPNSRGQFLSPSSGYKIVLPWNQRQEIPPKRFNLSTKLHGIKLQEKVIHIFTGVEISTLVCH